jgi:hypothetical protein
MLTLIRWGGVPMWFILLFGLLCLGGSALHALRPKARRLAFVRGMGLATLFSTLTGICADLAKVFVHIPERFGEQALPWPILFQGMAESLSPGIIGFTLLSLSALLSAVGAARPQTDLS